MKKRILLHSSYWVIVLIGLTILYGFSWQSHLLAFYFSALLLPIVMVTTYFFNVYLIPKYLFKQKYRLFTLYFFYMLVISLYLEMLVSLLSFVIVAKTDVKNVNIEGISIFTLGTTLYLIIFITSFIRLAIQYQKKEQQLKLLKSKDKLNQQTNMVISVNRKKEVVLFDDLFYIESLNDLVKLVLKEKTINTREKISSLNSKLPSQFIRIHRSFIINALKVISFSNKEVTINNTILPISRTYKVQVLEKLGNSSKIK